LPLPLFQGLFHILLKTYCRVNLIFSIIK
jgi:hypothetical protein